MKGSSIATVVFVATLTTIIAALAVNAMLGDPNDEKVEISYMDIVHPTVSAPDSEVFNIEAVNPTVEVYVGNCKDNELWDEDEQKCVAQSAGESGEDQETDETGE